MFSGEKSELDKNIDSLVTWPLGADPFNRMSATDLDCIVVIQFSESEGPKPLISFPSSPGSHFDLNALAVWLMTSDYDNSKICSTSGSSTVALVRNDEHGVQAMARHFTLFDIEARGFVRPACLAYITRNMAKLPLIFPELVRYSNLTLESLIRCNQRQFLKELSQTIDALDSMENRTIATYYELYYDENQLEKTMEERRRRMRRESACARLEAISKRARKLYGQMNAAYSVVAADLLTIRHHNQHINCSVHSVDVTAWLSRLSKDTIQPEKEQNDQQLLRPFADLAPCVYQDFCENVSVMWQKFSEMEISLRFFGVDCFDDIDGNRMDSSSTIDFCCNYPLTRLANCKPMKESNHNTERERDETHLAESDQKCHQRTCSISVLARFIQDENTTSKSKRTESILRSVLPFLPQILFPLLTGQTMVICAGQTRKPVAIELIELLHSLIPSNHCDTARVGWTEESIASTIDLFEYKICGQMLAAEKGIGECIADNIRPYVSVLDLNANVLHSGRYTGRLMECIEQKKTAQFSTDRSLLIYILSLLGDFGNIAYVLYYHWLYHSVGTNAAEGRIKTEAMRSLRLHSSDCHIARYLVQLLKRAEQRQSDRSKFDRFLDTLFLNQEMSNRSLQL